MVKVSVVYPKQDDARFDMDYYLGHHIPMTVKALGAALKGVSVEKGLSGGEPGSPPPFVVMCHFLCDSAEAFSEAFAPQAPEIMADVTNYTNIQPLIQFSEVKLSE